MEIEEAAPQLKKIWLMQNKNIQKWNNVSIQSMILVS